MKVDDVKQLMEKMSHTGITLLELEEEGMKLRLERPLDQLRSSAATNPAGASTNESAAVTVFAQENIYEETPDEDQGYTITSPVVGVFYAAPSPDHDPFVQVGSRIEAGSTLGIIEAMKLMNEVISDQAGTILKIMVENGQRVEYGQPLMIIGD